MNERIKELAEQAGLYVGVQVAHGVELERFAELVRQDERKACFAIVETYLTVRAISIAIRARGEK